MELAEKLLSNLFPARCLLCQKTVKHQADNEYLDLCLECLKGLPYNSISCVRCAVPLVDDLADNVLCGRCIKNTPAYDYAYSPLRYEENVIKLMHQLKLGGKITFARTFGEMMLQLLKQQLSQEHSIPRQNRPDCLLPVPLHHSRLRKRGFNQSIELARVMAKKLDIVIEYDAVNRNRSTLTQTGLDAASRRRNIKGAFSMVQKLAARHVLIIDDVMTTGSTVNELAKTLKKNGVERVGVISFARAPIKN